MRSGVARAQKSIASPWLLAEWILHGRCLKPSRICSEMAGLSSTTRMSAVSV